MFIRIPESRNLTSLRNRVRVPPDSGRPLNVVLFAWFDKLMMFSFAALGAALLSADSVMAADKDISDLLSLSLEDLSDYEVVAPAKQAVKLSEAPGAVSVITYDQIRNSTAKTIPELLRSVPGVNVRWNPMVQTIDIRSFGSNPFTSKVLLLIDGIPYNSWNKGGFPQHPGFDFLNLENVKHIEVIRGGGSALYGENALNGIINIVTLSGDEYRQTRVSAYAGERNTRSLSVSHGSKFGEEASIFGSIRKLNSQLPTAFWFEENDAESSSYDFYLKGKYKDFQASWYRLEDRFDGFSDPINAPFLPPGSAFTSADQIRQEVNIASFKYATGAEDESWTFEGNASYADRNGSSCASCHAAQQSSNFAATKDHGSQIFANAQFSYAGIPNHQLLVGAEYRDIETGENANEFAGSPEVGGTGATNNVLGYRKQSVFVQDSISLLDDRMDLTLGLRYDSATSPDLFEDQLFPRAALVTYPNEKLTVRASWNKAARYPSFTEIYQSSNFISASSPNAVIPLANFEGNPQLGPEHIESFEVGAEYEFSKHLHANINLYRNEVEDSIVIAYPRLRFENHPNTARLYGMEAELRAQLDTNLSGFLNWSYQNNSQSGSGTDSAGNPIDFTYSPKHKVNFGVTYATQAGFNLTLEGNWVDERNAPAFWFQFAFPQDPTVRPLDDYLYLHFRTDFNLPAAWLGTNDRLKISVNARNLTDERAIETLTGVDAHVSGREFFIGLEYDFTF